MTLKSLAIILALLFIFLQYKLWFASNGLRETAQLKAHIAKQTQANTRYRQKNHVLGEEIQALKKNPDQVETLARRQLGMIKPGETYYQFVKSAP